MARDRRWNARLGVELAAALLVLGAIAVAGTRLAGDEVLPITHVRVEGALERIGEAELREAMAGHLRGGFFSVDVAAIRARLEELPWVHSATVRRVWPDGLGVSVIERQALARWGEEGLLSSDGALFYPAPDSYPGGLPLLSGPAGSEAVVAENYLAFVAALAPASLTVTEVRADQRRSWWVALDNGMQLALGREAHYPRLMRFMRAYPVALAPRAHQVERVDLRYTNGFAVGWKEPAAEQDPRGGMAGPGLADDGRRDGSRYPLRS